MVNYCCVSGCGRNNRTSKHLYYYSVPKETSRQVQWLKLGGREDLLDKPPEKRVLHRFCSRHFSPGSIKNKHLNANAVPTLALPGSGNEEPAEDSNDDQHTHANISCNDCGGSIIGFRYKCMTCTNYDLCSRCEMTEAHSHHFMLRIPAPAKFKQIQNIVKKWQECYKETMGNIDDSSDDEPIKKYVKNYDSGVDLSEDVKESIRKEVMRVTQKSKKNVTSWTWIRPSKANKSSKIQKIESVDLTTLFSNTSEMVFEDVDEINNVVDGQGSDVKTEQPITFGDNLKEAELPVIQMKLSDDLSELMMEVQ